MIPHPSHISDRPLADRLLQAAVIVCGILASAACSAIVLGGVLSYTLGLL